MTLPPLRYGKAPEFKCMIKIKTNQTIIFVLLLFYNVQYALAGAGLSELNRLESIGFVIILLFNLLFSPIAVIKGYEYAGILAYLQIPIIIISLFFVIAAIKKRNLNLIINTLYTVITYTTVTMLTNIALIIIKQST